LIRAGSASFSKERLSHGISLEQAQDLVTQHSFDPVELVRAATRLSQSGD